MNKIKIKISLLVVMASLFIVAGCATSNIGSNSSTYSVNLGAIEQTGFQDLVDRLQRRYQYEVDRKDTYSNSEIYFRTYWKKRTPFTSDEVQDVKEVETRIILTAKAKTRQGNRLYNIKLQGEYRALLPTESGGEDFQRVQLTTGARSYFKEISSDLKDRIHGSIRGGF